MQMQALSQTRNNVRRVFHDNFVKVMVKAMGINPLFFRKELEIKKLEIKKLEIDMHALTPYLGDYRALMPMNPPPPPWMMSGKALSIFDKDALRNGHQFDKAMIPPGAEYKEKKLTREERAAWKNAFRGLPPGAEYKEFTDGRIQRFVHGKWGGIYARLRSEIDGWLEGVLKFT